MEGEQGSGMKEESGLERVAENASLGHCRVDSTLDEGFWGLKEALGLAQRALTLCRCSEPGYSTAGFGVSCAWGWKEGWLPGVGRHKIGLFGPFLLLCWAYSSIHYPAWPQGYTSAGFLNNSSLPCTALVAGREKRRDIEKLKNNCWQREESRQSLAGHADLQPTLPRCSLKSEWNQHPGSLRMERAGDSLTQRSIPFNLARWLKFTAKALLAQQRDLHGQRALGRTAGPSCVHPRVSHSWGPPGG